jgi:hypothetical protein
MTHTMVCESFEKVKSKNWPSHIRAPKGCEFRQVRVLSIITSIRLIS